MAYLGEIIDGKYEILRELGRGGMSIVYLAMDKRLNKQWAIKEFRKDKDDESRKIALEALLKEANIMKKLDHPTLPRIVDIIDLTGTIYIVMDYVEGESLNKVLDAYGAQPQDAVIEWAKQLSEVLDYLHTREPAVIYRDMKPAQGGQHRRHREYRYKRLRGSRAVRRQGSDRPQNRYLQPRRYALSPRHRQKPCRTAV